MSGAAGDPDEDFGNVFGGEGVGSFVNLLGPGNVAFETDDGELGFGQTWVNRGDADAGAVEFEAQRAGNLPLAGLGGAIGGAAFVSDMPCHGANVDKRTAGIAQHQRQGGSGHTQNAEHVSLQHRFPVIVFALGDGVHAVGAAGVVDEHIEAGDGGRKGSNQ